MVPYYNDHLSPEENEAVRLQKLQEDLSCPPLPLMEGSYYGGQYVSHPDEDGPIAPDGYEDDDGSEDEGGGEEDYSTSFKSGYDSGYSDKEPTAGESRYFFTGHREGKKDREHGKRHRWKGDVLPVPGENIEEGDEDEDDDERWHPTDDMPDDEPEGPEEGDYTTEDHVNFYQNGKKVLTVPGGADGDHVSALKKHMDKNQFWPNVWHISDHGNAHPIDMSGKPAGPQGGKVSSPAKVQEDGEIPLGGPDEEEVQEGGDGEGDDKIEGDVVAHHESYGDGFAHGYEGKEPERPEDEVYAEGHAAGARYKARRSSKAEVQESGEELDEGVDFDTSHYENSYGRSPRGVGSWAFHPDPNVDASSPEIIWAHQAKYADAKKQASAEAKKKGWNSLHVLT